MVRMQNPSERGRLKSVQNLNLILDVQRTSLVKENMTNTYVKIGKSKQEKKYIGKVCKINV